MPELTSSELETMQRLKQIHDMIRDSSENVLPISSLGQLASSLIMPTSTFVLTLLRQKPVITSLTDRLTR